MWYFSLFSLNLFAFLVVSHACRHPLSFCHNSVIICWVNGSWFFLLLDFISWFFLFLVWTTWSCHCLIQKWLHVSLTVNSYSKFLIVFLYLFLHLSLLLFLHLLCNPICNHFHYSIFSYPFYFLLCGLLPSVILLISISTVCSWKLYPYIYVFLVTWGLSRCAIVMGM